MVFLATSNLTGLSKCQAVPWEESRCTRSLWLLLIVTFMRYKRATFVLHFSLCQIWPAGGFFLFHESESSINCEYNRWIDLSGGIFPSCKLVSLEAVGLRRRELRRVCTPGIVIPHWVATASHDDYKVQINTLQLPSFFFFLLSAWAPLVTTSTRSRDKPHRLTLPWCHPGLQNKIKLVLLNYLLSGKSERFSFKARSHSAAKQTLEFNSRGLWNVWKHVNVYVCKYIKYSCLLEAWISPHFK